MVARKWSDLPPNEMLHKGRLMTHIYLFDVDGTLTPPRQPMKAHFVEFFEEFVATHKVFLISGSDYQKIQAQVPRSILDDCCGIFGCSGAEYVEDGNVIYQKQHEFSDALLTSVEQFVSESSYDQRLGNHIEFRPGMLNVSVVGRNANLDQRRHYHQWDQAQGERELYASLLAGKFGDYEASCGGEISIDIVPKGWNKSVVKQEVLEKFPGSQLTFFGDKMGPGGNDKPLADVLNTPSGRHSAIPVESYKDTWIHLKHVSAFAPKIPSAKDTSFRQMFYGGVSVH